MKVKMYNIISECVEKGAEHGYNRAHKYFENPDKVSMVDNIHREIMNELCEYFDFNGETYD
jgi:hypothetical protein